MSDDTKDFDSVREPAQEAHDVDMNEADYQTVHGIDDDLADNKAVLSSLLKHLDENAKLSGENSELKDCIAVEKCISAQLESLLKQARSELTDLQELVSKQSKTSQDEERSYVILTQAGHPMKVFRLKTQTMLDLFIGVYASETGQDVHFLSVYGKHDKNLNNVIQPSTESLRPGTDVDGGSHFHRYELKKSAKPAVDKRNMAGNAQGQGKKKQKN